MTNLAIKVLLPILLSVGLVGAAYLKGRGDMKEAYEDRIDELAAEHAQALQDQALLNAERVAEVRAAVRSIEQENEDIQDELAATDDLVCPVSPERQRLLQRALSGSDR